MVRGDKVQQEMRSSLTRNECERQAGRLHQHQAGHKTCDVVISDVAFHGHNRPTNVSAGVDNRPVAMTLQHQTQTNDDAVYITYPLAPGILLCAYVNFESRLILRKQKICDNHSLHAWIHSNNYWYILE